MRNIHYMFLTLMAVLVSSCLYEYPEMTSDGEEGVDPTGVEVKVNLSLNMNMVNAAPSTITTRATAEPEEYRHRFIVEAHSGGGAVRQTLYEDIVPGRTNITIPVTMKLHARNYQLVVWADYVKADQAGDLYYDTETLSPVFELGAYRGNTEQKDVLTGSVELNLTMYRSQWNGEEQIDMTLRRPLGRYELITTDVADFISSMGEANVQGKVFTARIKYAYDIFTGFDAYSQQVCNRLRYMQYTTNFRILTDGTTEMRIGFDYLFIADEEKDVPIELEIVDAQGVTVSRSVFSFYCKRNKNAVVKGDFLCAEPSKADDGNGIEIQTDYDEEINILVK